MSAEKAIADAKRDLAFINESGQKEDIALVSGIQRGLGSGANTEFLFGYFEPALVHLHKQLSEHLATN